MFVRNFSKVFEMYSFSLLSLAFFLELAHYSALTSFPKQTNIQKLGKGLTERYLMPTHRALINVISKNASNWL